MKLNYTNVDALGTAKFLIAGEKFIEAKQAIDLIRPYAKTIDQLDQLGKCYAEARAWRDMYDIASQLYNVHNEPARGNTRHSMIRALLNLNRPAQALTLIDEQDQCMKMHEDAAFNTMERAMALFMLNRKAESRRVLSSITTSNPELQDRIMYNLATHLIADGDFKNGYAQWVTLGRDLNSWKKSPLPEIQRWVGEAAAGKVLVVVAEGGIGDEIINVRFLENISMKGIQVMWYTDREDLADVFRANGYVTIDSLQNFHPTWLWTYSFDLPWLLGLEESDLWKGPYIRARTRGPLHTKTIPTRRVNYMRVGIKCQGNPLYEQDLHRNINVDKILNVIPSVSDVYMFDLDAEENHFIYGNRRWLLDIKCWDDTFDYLAEMDVVVTTCTSVAHAASAMGKKTCILVPIMSYYPWVKPGNTSPWYGQDTVLFRQEEVGNWDKPLAELKKYLENYKASIGR